MANINFPNNPSVNDEFLVGGKTYVWDGVKWVASTTITKADVGLGNVQNFSIANQSEAEAGSVDNKYMTPLRTAQAIPNKASISHPTDTGSVTNTHTRQVNASETSTASADRSQVNASRDSTATDLNSQVNASFNSTASGGQSQVNASRDSTASGTRSQVNASDDSTASANVSQVNASTNSTASGVRSQVNASNNATANGAISQINASENCIASGSFFSQVNSSSLCTASGSSSQVHASRRVINNVAFSLAGGDAASGDPSTANRKWHIFSATGNISIAGSLTSSASFSDFAELFPNATGKEQGYGLLQTLDGDKVKPAQEGDKVIGVVSGTAGLLLNDTPFHWQGRYLIDEWGMPIYEEIPDPDYELQEGETEAPLIKVQKENPNYDIEREQISRKERTDEWTVVGLTGQVYVRLNEDVKVGDYVKAWQDGVGQTSEEDTNLIVMKITQPYDSKKGYSIGFCLIK